MSEENKNTILSTNLDAKKALNSAEIEMSQIRTKCNKLTREYYNEEIIKKIAPQYIGKCYKTKNNDYILILQPPKLLEGRCDVHVNDTDWNVIRINSFEDETPYGDFTGDGEVEITPYFEDEYNLYFLFNYPNSNEFTEISREEFNKKLEEAIEFSKKLITERINNILPRIRYRF